MSGNSDLRPVTVIGLGPMGQAMATALMRAGHPVTLWNRTPSRADALVAGGANLAPTPAAAVAASQLTILSLTDYPAMYDILGPVASQPGALAGHTLVNLSSDTPDTSRQAAEWATGHGARFVTGGVMVPAPAIGTNEAYVFYSGAREAFQHSEPVLRIIGEPRYLGTDPGLAQLFYQAHLDVFLTCLSSLLHATALVTTAGVPPAEFLPGALTTLTDIPAMIGDGLELARALEAGEHPGDLSTTRMMGATAEHILRTSEALGVDVALPKAVRSHYERAVAAGHGDQDWTALYEVIRAQG
ncbi:NAD(P)-dependent oxidoreductase [Verrucosispora sioxanthis]|uniref:NAD(P)-dependent oxidoreductase n=1 Tax=Verrucosispora sioxanthis TaxID=2499994 RepID=A0A6M1LDD5_9ACTN|nr:NAD(P)-binding domain-containing protein [Verrucosispora sioxanthis]NEE66994.1 NAD(P)-dependent oxidoreductase [Verrucosispora sioxanthis]NGM16104.1 NAD(P)-dependent oxidoreductase [Verrucosispora sioxanthis]